MQNTCMLLFGYKITMTDTPTVTSSTDSLKIDNAVRTFVEEEVHDGKIGLEAVFSGKDLEIRLFKFHVLKYGVRTFGMDGLAQVFACQHGPVRTCLDSFA